MLREVLVAQQLPVVALIKEETAQTTEGMVARERTGMPEAATEVQVLLLFVIGYMIL
jgi:hypothetical protein